MQKVVQFTNKKSHNIKSFNDTLRERKKSVIEIKKKSIAFDVENHN